MAEATKQTGTAPGHVSGTNSEAKAPEKAKPHKTFRAKLHDPEKAKG